ncbi:TrbC/VirB2 family protein [Acidiphilium sp. PA]|uniref:TrbC/VirB2 family protein n=1 Tax=Acidiphilium sp. PA TaxID=2871705 RepID=UPI0038CFB1AB
MKLKSVKTPKMPRPSKRRETPVDPWQPKLVAILAGAMLWPASALAAGSNMPWEQPLQQILNSIEGPVAKIIAVLIIIGTGLGLAFGESSGGMRRLIQIVFGLSIAFAAASFFLTFFNFSGGALVG